MQTTSSFIALEEHHEYMSRGVFERVSGDVQSHMIRFQSYRQALGYKVGRLPA
jgi:hypothetical protein